MARFSIAQLDETPGVPCPCGTARRRELLAIPGPGDTLYVRLSFWTATSPSSGSWADEVIPITYTSPTLEYHGTCSKGAFTLTGGGGWSHEGTPTAFMFELSFDEETPVPEDYSPNPGATYKPLHGPFGLDNDPVDPAGQYTLRIFDNGRPYPDWSAFVSHTPFP